MTPRTTRQRMLDSAVALLQQGGASAVTLDAVLSHSGAPRGSIYHHFPGGRSQLLLEAGEMGADFIASMIEQTTGGALELLDSFVGFWKTTLTESDYRSGCPVAALVLAPLHDPAGSIAASAFARWAERIEAVLVDAGASPEEARALASGGICAIEGAILVCRAQGSTQALDDVAQLLRHQLESRGLAPSAAST